MGDVTYFYGKMTIKNIRLSFLFVWIRLLKIFIAVIYQRKYDWYFRLKINGCGSFLHGKLTQNYYDRNFTTQNVPKK